MGISLHLHSQDVKFLDLGKERDHPSVAECHRLLYMDSSGETESRLSSLQHQSPMRFPLLKTPLFTFQFTHASLKTEILTGVGVKGNGRGHQEASTGGATTPERYTSEKNLWEVEEEAAKGWALF